MISRYVFLFLALTACTTTVSKEEGQYTFSHEYSDSLYESTIDDNTKSVKSYDGPSEQFQFDATLLNTSVIEAQLWRNATDFRWSRDKYLEERRDTDKKSGEVTEIFLSFHTPINEVDNLNTDRSLWKIFLDSGGKRYEASVNKLSGALSERQRLFPFHTRFSTPYVLTFKIPVVQVQQTDARMILTGPAGSGEVVFKALSQNVKTP